MMDLGVLFGLVVRREGEQADWHQCGEGAAMWLLGARGWSALMVQERQGQGADRAGGVSKSKSKSSR